MRTRTTLAIDDDLLDAARAIAEQQSKTVGEVVSELMRQSLRPRRRLKYRNGIPLLPKSGKGGVPVTLELVNRLRDESP